MTQHLICLGHIPSVPLNIYILLSYNVLYMKIKLMSSVLQIFCSLLNFCPVSVSC